MVHPAVYGDCVTVLNQMLQDHESRPLGPTSVFLDQFGYGDVPLILIRRVLEHLQCEVLT